MKALMPLTSAPLADAKAFLAGSQPWRMLAIPFGGPIPSPKSPRGVDLDGQWFSERTDIYGQYAQLKATRDRVVDWHHSLAPVNNRGGDPRGLMNGVVLGKAVLDEQPDEAGWWADFWITAGEKKRALLDRLVERAASLYASAQPVSVANTKADPLTGEILAYPMWAVTVTTSPQNHLAVVTPKALLAELDSDETPAGIRGLLAELDALGADLPQTFHTGGDAAAKAGGVSQAIEAVEDALGTWEDLRDRLRAGRSKE